MTSYFTRRFTAPVAPSLEWMVLYGDNADQQGYAYGPGLPTDDEARAQLRLSPDTPVIVGAPPRGRRNTGV